MSISGSASGVLDEVDDKLDEVRRGYAPEGEHPIGGYGVLLGVHGLVHIVLGRLVKRRTEYPLRFSGRDLALLAVATHKMSRLLTKDSITGALRAPFTQFEEATGEGEVAESVRGSGLRHAVGELVTCPFCIAVWVATFLAYGFVLAPRFTRFVASILCAVTGSDYLQFLYAELQRLEHR